MLALSFLFSDYTQSDKWYWWLLLPFCFISSAMHEAIGAPLACSLILLVILTPFYKEGSILRRMTLLAMIAGGFFTLSSPASYKRVGSLLQPESPILIVFGSGIFVVILLLLIIYLLKTNRELLFSMIRSKWIVFAGISMISSGFMLLSGFGGRTGWFAQLFGIIALCQIIRKLDINLGGKTGWFFSIVMSVLIIAHLCEVVRWQNKLAKETREVISQYKKSVDGIVFFDYTKDYQIPWYLLRKNHGVPDDDDSYYRYCMRTYYGDGKQLVVLPTAFYPIPDSLPDPVSCGEYILTSRKPESVSGDTIVARFPREITYIDGKEYIINGFDYRGRHLYLLSQMDRDRGEK